jgi:prepilin-type N-terminal cleavage/methylation domain-containing protein
MRALFARLRRREDGYSLIELMAGLAIFTVVIGATLSLLEAGVKAAPKEQERANAIRESQAGVHRMSRELRQATKILSTNSHWVEFEARLQNNDPATSGSEPYRDRHILYSCGDQNPGRCVRYETAKGQVLPATGSTVVPRVLNWNVAADSPRRVFTFPDGDAIAPESVNLRIEVPSAGERPAGGGYRHAVTLEDGVTLRNLSGG